MNRLIKFSIISVGVLAFSSLALAQYQMDITGDPYGSIGPYTGNIYTGGTVSGTTVVGGTLLYSGAIICDDTATDIPVPYAWNATATSLSSLGGSELYNTDTYGGGYTTQQVYDAAAYLANELLGSPGNSVYQNALWDLFDNNTAEYLTAEKTDIAAAFAANYNGAGWEVITPVPGTASQEFLVQTTSVPTPEPVAAAVLGVNVFMGLGLLLFRRRRSV
jgi:hypothetical protein